MAGSLKSFARAAHSSAVAATWTWSPCGGRFITSTGRTSGPTEPDVRAAREIERGFDPEFDRGAGFVVGFMLRVIASPPL
jgi:hypothetical protein